MYREMVSSENGEKKKNQSVFLRPHHLPNFLSLPTGWLVSGE